MRIASFLIVCLALSSCDRNKNEEIYTIDSHWSYKGETSPEHWVEIERNSECGGHHQSPINIIEYNTVSSNDTGQLELFYSSKTHLNKATNNGHTIQFDFVPEEDS